MEFDAAGVRAASAGLGALAGRAGANGQALLKTAHAAIRLPEDRVTNGFREGASAFLTSPEGKAALHGALQAGWALLRGIFGGAVASSAVPGSTGPSSTGPLAQSGTPQAPPASPPPGDTSERAGNVG